MLSFAAIAAARFGRRLDATSADVQVRAFQVGLTDLPDRNNELPGRRRTGHSSAGGEVDLADLGCGEGRLDAFEFAAT